MTRYTSTLHTAAAAAMMATLGMATAIPSVQAKLKTALDPAHARVGEAVTAVTTANFRENGRLVLPRGSVLSGKVTRAAVAPNKRTDSQLGVVFRRAVTPQGAQIRLRGGIDFLTAARHETANLPQEISFSPLRGGGGYLLSAKGNFRIAAGMIAQVAITQGPTQTGT